MTVVRLEGVGRRYRMRGPWVLRDVDLDVPSRALLRIEGPNGTGKSTLLRLLAGIDSPTAGRVTGRPATAYVPERFPAALPFDAAGYLTHLGRVHGLPGPRAARRAADWLERFGITRYAGTPMERLSKGTTQKVAVAQALLAEPGLLVLDEAWTGLDTAARGVLDDAVADQVAAGGTVVFVDHDPRRLAGTTTAVHRVEGARLVVGARRTAVGAGRVLVDAVASAGDDPGGGAGAADGAVGLPQGLPPSASVVPASPDDAGRRDGGAGVRISVAAGESDAVLRALLTADPPWHILGVRPDARTAGPGEETP